MASASGLGASRIPPDPLESKPLGVYTWTTELTDVFRQDRMLQTRLSGESLAHLGSVMRKREDLKESYEKLLAIGERLTNYCAYADLRKYIASATSVNDEDTAALFPPCASPETTLNECFRSPQLCQKASR